MNGPPSNDRLVGRLLGPVGPELSCEQCFDELDRFVAAIPGMRAHLQGCSACAEDHESLRALVTDQASDA
jgi:hypothetical protein